MREGERKKNPVELINKPLISDKQWNDVGVYKRHRLVRVAKTDQQDQRGPADQKGRKYNTAKKKRGKERKKTSNNSEWHLPTTAN